ncbi:hypothetical protein GZH47_01520 [Paenibacillus rhizovicinus]|uniref:Uncharacterized protein n=1 Tax=Paenibacillus rhizovicinus TaxID=2704463 RepID=A0A6C0NYT8_9BACL|nr:hypothetical protein [Paenibacillus rhizovicinus]QHW29642.1 hypothetical protein GZH47_01520 [Paenibacillus rhizovicinus]
MQNKRTVTKIAAIALMLTAVASPIVANAATVPLSNIYATALTEAGEGVALPVTGTLAATKAVALADPLELAKQYAPDTEAEWKKTLAAFDKLVKSDVTFTTTSGPLHGEVYATGQAVQVTGAWTSASVSGAAMTQATLASSPQSVTITKIVDGRLQKAADLAPDFKAASMTTAQAIPVSGVDVHFDGDFKDAASKSGTPVKSATIAIQASPIDNPLFNGQIELSKAAESKDAEAIKQALSKLLELYKAEIEKLQQAE